MPAGVVDLGCNTEELLAVLMSREVRDWEISACGAVSMIPAAALLLAEATHAPHAEIIILGSEQLSGNCVWPSLQVCRCPGPEPPSFPSTPGVQYACPVNRNSIPSSCCSPSLAMSRPTTEP